MGKKNRKHKKGKTHYVASIDEETVTRKRVRAAPLKRHILASDNHALIGRLYDLSIIAYHFETYEDLSKHSDCKYAFDCGEYVTTIARRVETLNLAGDMLWPEPIPASFADFPVSRYDWLTIAADVFLMRYVSIVDCALIFTNAIFETGLDAKKCSLDNLKKKGVTKHVLDILQEMLDDQGGLRLERNARFHHGEERGFTQDDQTFRTAALFERHANGIRGNDRSGRRINTERYFREGLVELQRAFNASTRRLVRRLDDLYSALEVEFESRFGPRVRAATHGLNSRRPNS